MANKTTFYVRIYSRHDHDLMMYYLSIAVARGQAAENFLKCSKRY